jgi:hypothetical protein
MSLRSPLSWALCVLPLAAPALPAQLGVTAVSPTRNAVAAATGTTIAITFASAVDPLTVTSASLEVFGRWSGPTPGVLSFENGNQTVRFTPSRPFFPGETVSVMLSRSVSGPSGALTGGHAWMFNTRSAAGSRSFQLTATLPVRRSGEGRVRLYGAYAGDIDGDGAPDLSLPCEDASDLRVLMNNGCGEFPGTPVPYAMPTNSKPSTNEGQDFDGDGFTDLAIGNINGVSITVFLGDGAGGYRPGVTYPSGDGTRGLAVLDVEGDGDVDIVTANRFTSNLALHRNNGNGTFAPATFFEGGGTGETGVMAADANCDGIMDLFVANYTSQTVTLMLGNGNGGFALSATQAVDGQPWMIAVGDVDGDGHVDAATCNSSRARASVVRGNGQGGLLPAVHYVTGSFPLAIDLGDLDGDRDLDMVVSNFSGSSFSVLWNNGSGGFGSPMTLTAPAAGSCALLVDHDRDGDLDIIGFDELDDLILLFRQNGPSPAGVQPPACASALRVDNFADRGGFGTAAPHTGPIGGRFFVGVTAPPGQSYALAVGVPVEPGVPMFLGTLNLALAPIVFLPARTANAHGEDTQELPVPGSIAPGVALTFQAVVLDPSLPALAVLTNPEHVVLQ